MYLQEKHKCKGLKAPTLSLNFKIIQSEEGRLKKKYMIATFARSISETQMLNINTKNDLHILTILQI